MKLPSCVPFLPVPRLPPRVLLIKTMKYVTTIPTLSDHILYRQKGIEEWGRSENGGYQLITHALTLVGVAVDKYAYMLTLVLVTHATRWISSSLDTISLEQSGHFTCSGRRYKAQVNFLVKFNEAEHWLGERIDKWGDLQTEATNCTCTNTGVCCFYIC